MTPMEVIANEIENSPGMMQMHLADFSEAEMLKRPVPGANHVTWQLGHLIKADANLGKLLGANVAIPEQYHELFGKEMSKSDDASKFPKKAELLAKLKEGRATVAQAVRKMDPAKLNDPSPENMRKFFPTIGSVVLLYNQHSAMHVGQIQVLRRALGKPVLF
jgi:hypothetical protein